MTATPDMLNNRYRITQVLGEGGFGKTYLAQDTHMPSLRTCVIKQLKPVTQGTELVQELFRREAATLESMGLAHDQIPSLYAYFFENDTFYLVQEWVEGKTLSQWLRESGALSEATVKQILLNLLPVLIFIHDQRLIHRDIKPDNIIIRQRDHLPVLIDFGIVKEAAATQVDSHGQLTLSIVGGTPGFMSSEQAAGRPIFSSDLFSLGLTAIYLLTKKMPNQLPTDHYTGELKWREFCPYLSADFAAILERSVQVNPRERYPTAEAMLQDLQALELSSPGLDETIVPGSRPSLTKTTGPKPQPTAQVSTVAQVSVPPTIRQPASLPPDPAGIPTDYSAPHPPSQHAERQPLGLSFIGLWSLANSIGLFIGMVSFGLGQGILQWFVLRRFGYQVGPLWVAMTVVAYLINIAIIQVGVAIGLGAPIVGLLALVFYGVTLGLLQLFALGRVMAGSGWWLPVNALAPFIALMVGFIPAVIFDLNFNSNQVTLTTLFIMSVINGGLTGTCLALLSRLPQP